MSALALTRASILLFYLSIFGWKLLRILVYIALALNLGQMFAIDIASAFQCQPFDYMWLSWDGTQPPAKCLNLATMLWANGAMNIALDLITVILPLVYLYHLPLSRPKKIQVAFMFSIGLL